MVQVSFSTDTTNLVKPLFETIQTNHVRKSSAMMQTHFICGVWDKIFLLVILKFDNKKSTLHVNFLSFQEVVETGQTG